MRILFSSVPAYGHLLPLAPLVHAAIDAGHAVALTTSAGMADAVAAELHPDVEFLPAGPMPAEFSAEAARRTGADVFHPTPQVIGEIFGGARLDMGIQEAMVRAHQWRPDIVLADAFDAIAPTIATALDLSWYQVGVGPALPKAITDEIEACAAERQTAAGLTPLPPAGYIDPCPPMLQDPDWTPAAPVHTLRPQPHSRPHDPARPDQPLQDRPTVLVTLGTIFSATELLNSIVEAVSSHGVNIVATIGSALRLSDEDTPEDDATRPEGVEYLPFVPMDDLLDGVDVVIGAGGAGTVLAALSRGIPMILWPQGADQPLNAARAAAAGVAITVESAAEIKDALARLLHEPGFRDAAEAVADEIAQRPSAHNVLTTITNA